MRRKLIWTFYFNTILFLGISIADQNSVEKMIVIDVEGKKITGNKGIHDGVTKESVYGIKRISADLTKHIGIAIVFETEKSCCHLKAYVSRNQSVKKGDLLIIDSSATNLLLETYKEDYWDNLQVMKNSSEDHAMSDGKAYKKSRILLKSGETMKDERFIVRGSDELIFPSSLSMHPKLVKLQDVETIFVPTKNYLQHGALSGALLTGVVIFAIDLKKQPETKIFYKTVPGPGGSLQTILVRKTIENKLPTILKTVVVAGGTILGAIIGHSINGGWKCIYPSEKTVDKVSININFFTNYPQTSFLGITCRFRI